MESIKKNSRTVNTLYNFIINIGGQFITILMQFIVRTIFIQTLGKSYLGINGLFSNILSMLSLAELGVGNAILFKLYEPLSKNDTKRINILMKFYKKVYILIGITVTIIGLILIPFLHLLVNDYNKLESLGINAIFIYILYLLQSVSSYLFWAYKSAIVKADQKEYIINLVTYGFTILSSVAQIIVLKVLNNFEIYIMVLIISVILQNYINAIIANKMYPFINEKEDKSIEKKEVIDIIKDCSAIFLYRLNNVVLKATDNIIISFFLGLEMVGMYSNYYILYTTINTVFSKVFDSVTHSLGNLHTTHDYTHEHLILKTINFIAVILGATGGIGIFCVANEFINVWIGDSWIIMQPFALLMGIEIYSLAIRVFLSKYRSAMGLFQQAKYRPLFGMVINLIVSILLVKNLGICGVLIGTIIADWTTIMWYDPYIIYKHGLNGKFSIKKYYIMNCIYIIFTCIIGIIDYIICSNIFLNRGWLSVIIHSAICGISVPLILFVVFRNTDEGKQILKLKDKILNK